MEGHLRRAGKPDQPLLLRASTASPACARTATPSGRATYDERGNKTSVSYFGTDGKPCLNVDEVCRMEGHFTTSGETRPACPSSAPMASPACSTTGIAGWTATYDERGNKTSGSFFGIDGKPCLNINGIAGWKATYDQRGNESSRSYFGIKGEAIIAPKLGYHRAVTKYDPNGKVLEVKYFDCQGKPYRPPRVPQAAAQEQAQK